MIKNFLCYFGIHWSGKLEGDGLSGMMIVRQENTSRIS